MAKNQLLSTRTVYLLAAIIVAFAFGGLILLINSGTRDAYQEAKIISGSLDTERQKTDEEWKEILTSEEFHILREKGTDRPFTKELTDNKKSGIYISVGCDTPVFSSVDKYDSGTGWPSFTQPINKDAIVLAEDYELGYKRIEVMDKCGGHLGHVFEDGPEPTGFRYCINATALKFIPS